MYSIHYYIMCEGYLWSIIDYDKMIVKNNKNTNELCINNYAYKDLMQLLVDFILHVDFDLSRVIYKIIINDKNIKDDPRFYIFSERRISYEQTKMYIKYVNDVQMLIKYFYNQIKTSNI